MTILKEDWIDGVLNKFLATSTWRKETPEETRQLVERNLRGLANFIRLSQPEPRPDRLEVVVADRDELVKQVSELVAASHQNARNAEESVTIKALQWIVQERDKQLAAAKNALGDICDIAMSRLP